MNSAANYDFVLKKRTFTKGTKVRHAASSTLPRMKQKGLKIAKGTSLALLFAGIKSRHQLWCFSLQFNFWTAGKENRLL